MQRSETPCVLAGLLAIGLISGVPFAVHAQSGNPGQSMYRYVNAAGRVVYTNIPEQVPLEQRSTALVDLRRVQLNTEVGNDLRRRVDEQYAALHASSYCQGLRTAAEQTFLTKLWDDYAPLLACGAALLVLFVATPGAMRRFGAPAWARVLSMAIPALAISGLIMFSMTATNKALIQLKQRAKPCQQETFAKLDGEPDALRKQTELVDQLEHEIASVERVRE